MQNQFHSSVGCVVDVATPSKRKLRALGVLWIVIALLPLAIINYLIIQFLTSADPMITNKPIPFLGALLMPVLAWYSLWAAQCKDFARPRLTIDISEPEQAESQSVFPMTISAAPFSFRLRLSNSICHGIESEPGIRLCKE